MRFTVHAPVATDPLTADGRSRLTASIDFASAMGASLVVLHLPTPAQLSAWVLSLRDALVCAGRAGVDLALENTVHHSPLDCNRAFSAVTCEYGQQAPVGFCLDIGHANLCQATRNDYLGFLAGLQPELPLIHVHLHENWGDADSHLPLFTGPSAHDESGLLALVQRLRAREYIGAFILEQWPDPPELLVRAAERFGRLLASG